MKRFAKLFMQQPGNRCDWTSGKRLFDSLFTYQSCSHLQSKVCESKQAYTLSSASEDEKQRAPKFTIPARTVEESFRAQPLSGLYGYWFAVQCLASARLCAHCQYLETDDTVSGRADRRVQRHSVRTRDCEADLGSFLTDNWDLAHILQNCGAEAAADCSWSCGG